MLSELGFLHTNTLHVHCNDSAIPVNLPNNQTIPVSCDNQGAIKLARNPIFHARTKHIELHHHFVRESVSDGEISLHYIPTSEQPADILTKFLGRARFEFHRSNIEITQLLDLHPKPKIH